MNPQGKWNQSSLLTFIFSSHYFLTAYILMGKRSSLLQPQNTGFTTVHLPQTYLKLSLVLCMPQQLRLLGRLSASRVSILELSPLLPTGLSTLGNLQWVLEKGCWPRSFIPTLNSEWILLLPKDLSSEMGRDSVTSMWTWMHIFLTNKVMKLLQCFPTTDNLNSSCTVFSFLNWEVFTSNHGRPLRV